MRRYSHFDSKLWPYTFLFLQIALIVIFIFWPAVRAIVQSLFRSDAFGIHNHFVWLQNFADIFTDSTYLNSLWITILFSFFVTLIVLASGLFMAVLANRVIRLRGVVSTLLIWPYAVAPVIAGVLWSFLFNPAVGIVSYALDKMGYQWDFLIHGRQALVLVIISAAWQQFSYNFIFFFAGLQAIPKSLIEAAALDGASPWSRFWNIILPLLSPITFFLIVTNLVYAFFDTFGIIQFVTQGGPANATNILVYRVYRDGFVGLNYGSSAAQSVILMVIVTILTVIQFKYIEKKVHY
jgi:sn-glycerol 3-phosphate transport system permease protein